MLEFLMETDDNIVVMTADLAGSSKLKKIEDRFPDRFINVGIAEQNMISIAAGLAHEGLKPFVHTFRCFPVCGHANKSARMYFITGRM